MSAFIDAMDQDRPLRDRGGQCSIIPTPQSKAGVVMDTSEKTRERNYTRSNAYNNTNGSKNFKDSGCFERNEAMMLAIEYGAPVLSRLPRESWDGLRHSNLPNGGKIENAHYWACNALEAYIQKYGYELPMYDLLESKKEIEYIKKLFDDMGV